MLELADRTVELTQGSAGSYEARGRLLDAMQRYDEAHRDFRRSYEGYSEALGTHHSATLIALGRLANAYRRSGQLDEAIALYEQFRQARLESLGRNSSSTETTRRYLAQVYKEAVQTFRQLGRTDEALELLEQWECTTPGEFAIRAGIYGQLGASAAAERDNEQAYRLEPTTRQAFQSRAQMSLERGQYQAALDDLATAEERFGALDGHMYKRRGLACFRLGQFSEALAEIAKGMEVDSSDASNLTWIPPREMAACPDESFRQGMLELADRTIELTEGSANAYAARGLLYLAVGDLDAAGADFGSAAAADGAIYRWYQYALVALVRGDQPAYRDACLRMLEMCRDTSDATEVNFAAWTCALADGAVADYASALELAQRSVELRGQNRQSLNALGAMFYRAGRYDEAHERLLEALEAAADDDEPNIAPACDWYFLAMTCARLGEQEEALRWYAMAAEYTQRVVAEEPDMPWNRRLTLELLHKEAQQVVEVLVAGEASSRSR